MSRNGHKHVATIARSIHYFNGQNVLLDSDLAALYGVLTKALLQAVRRNGKRFPSDFMFQLSVRQVAILRSQFVTSSYGGRRYRPYAFTEQGVAMLSSVLRSDTAIRVNIAIMRAFVQVRQAIKEQRKLRDHLQRLESRVGRHDKEIADIFEAIRQLMMPPARTRRRIGF